jgi:Gluconate 2-dehydrogenase subunit 3
VITGEFGRRAALRTLAGGAVGIAASGSWVESLCALARQHAHEQAASSAIAAQTWTPRVLTPAQNDLVITLTELIIPETTTPGAKATLVNRFIDSVLYDAPAKERDRFTGGLAWMDSRSKVLFGKDFLTSTPAEQTTLLTRLSQGADSGTAEAADRPGVDFFKAIKSMTISGYYTTEVGLMKELGDDGVLAMAEFKGCDHPEHQ